MTDKAESFSLFDNVCSDSSAADTGGRGSVRSEMSTTDTTQSQSATLASADASNTIIVDSDDGHESVLSHCKTPLPQPRNNPALLLQQMMSSLQDDQGGETLETAVAMARKFSTDKCDNYRDSSNKVKILMDQLSHMVRQGMPVHAAEQITQEQESPEVLLIHGIMMTGDGEYQTAVDRFKQALTLCDARRKKSQGVDDMATKEIRINCLNQIGISLCLLNNFDEAERYFQFALEEYCRDENLISHIVDKYSKLATGAGPQFVHNSPIHRFIEATNNDQSVSDPQETSQAAGAAGKDLGAAAGAPGEQRDAFSRLSWFPATKEELLDYSAAYIQMMIMGAEMVRSQQQGKHAAAADRTPDQCGENLV